MKLLTYGLSFAALAAAAPALAQSDRADQAPSGERWGITVTPRYQQLFFLPNIDADGAESMSTYGLSVAARSPDARFGVMATYMRGRASGTYTYDDDFFTGDYDYRASRREIALTGEYTPRESNVTLMFGYHNFRARNRETLINPGPGNSETGDYRFTVNAAEFGLRFNSRLGVDSPHSLSAQFAFGIGPGRARVNVTEVFGGVTTVTNTNESGTGYVGDIALGYNVFLSDRVAIGARLRGYVWYVDAANADPIFAAAPEINLTFRF